MSQIDNKVMPDVIEKIASQFDEIISNYQQMVQQLTQEKEEAEIQAELMNARVASLEAEKESLSAALTRRQSAGAVFAAKESEDLKAECDKLRGDVAELTAARDGLRDALMKADGRIRALETQLKEKDAAPAAESAPAAEPAPVAAGPVPAAEPAPVAAEPVPTAEPVPAAAEPAPAQEMPEPDFEDQKKVLLKMQEELAELERRIRKG